MNKNKNLFLWVLLVIVFLAGGYFVSLSMMNSNNGSLEESNMNSISTSSSETTKETPIKTSEPATVISEPSISLLSPTGGETFIHQKSEMTIAWESKNPPAGSYVQVGRMLCMQKTCVAEEIATGLSTTGKIAWRPTMKLAANQTPGIEAEGDATWSGFIRVRLCKEGGKCYYTERDIQESYDKQNPFLEKNRAFAEDINIKPFRVVTENQLPLQLKIVSPNGGEKLKAGNKYLITWSSSNLPSYELVALGYRSTEQSSELGDTPIAHVPNSGSYEWLVPANMITGTYKIGIYFESRSGGYGGYDHSDGIIDVDGVPPPPPLPNTYGYE